MSPVLEWAKRIGFLCIKSRVSILTVVFEYVVTNTLRSLLRNDGIAVGVSSECNVGLVKGIE